MKLWAFALLVLSLALPGVLFAGEAGIMTAQDEWQMDDTRSIAPCTRGIQEPHPRYISPRQITAFGDLLGEWSWSSIGIQSYYSGAGISSHHPYLFICSQRYHRLYIVDISTGVPTSPVWLSIAPPSL